MPKGKGRYGKKRGQSLKKNKRQRRTSKSGGARKEQFTKWGALKRDVWK